MYRTTEVKLVCQVVYGREIPERTWVRWREKLNLPKYLRYCSSGQMEQLISLANLRRTKPFDQITLKMIVQNKSEALRAYNNVSESMPLPSLCSGKELPNLLTSVLGESVSLKTLYRWSKQYDYVFSTNTNYTKKEIEQWIFIAHHVRGT